MKSIYLVFLLLSAVFLFSCEEKGSDGNYVLGPGGPGGGNVTFKIGIVQDEFGANYFGANPSAAVKIASVIIMQTNLSVNETLINPNPDEIFSPLQEGNFYGITEVPAQAQAGQLWSFRFKGTFAQGGQSFDVTTNYTVQ